MINVVRDQPAPPSLASQKSYRSPDVIEALHQVFKGKCYLTEKVFDSPNEMEVDHFITQTERPDLVFDWQNLYAIDQKANKQRPKRTPIGGYLDPCNAGDDVEQEITYIVEYGGNSLFKARDSTNQKAVNTAALLNHAHKDLKPAINNKHHEVVLAVAEWHTAKTQGDIQTEFEKELLLRKLLSRDSHFTMLMRAIWAVQSLPNDFFD
ncbi:hypothetical protein [Spirosoma fluviale]|uniref:TIGR02646 family protein n=1 Tax=Spirosoma fluviale TaxID=1597977 RepID=A0A286F6B0_9BACT|nr:hypothetical protein [Spirosoma fluviale]SOD78740.1 hypothetical protein SAMN06269250_0617 [Spirosoma fluviale]